MCGNASIAGGLQGFRAWMADRGLDVCVISDLSHITYLSGALLSPNRPAALLVTGDEARLVAPASAAASTADGVALATYEDYAIEHTVDMAANAARSLEAALACIGSGGGRVGLEPSHLPAAFRDLVQRVTGVSEWCDVHPALQRLRQAKSTAEIGAIARAATACDDVFRAVESAVHAGSSELDAYLAAVRMVARASAGPAVLDGDFVSGPRTEEIGGLPTPRALVPGDLLIVDVYPRIGAYWADCTRTYVAGEPSQALLDQHALLEEALEAGEQALEPGRPVREVYQVVRGVLDRAGVGEYFPHHAGHGVGLAPAEPPWLVPGSDARLAEGMVITLEPGLYIPGQGGMRLEDDFMISAGGCRCLSHYPRRLVPLASD